MGTATVQCRPQPTWSSEVDDLVRAASGGLLFGVPLLYTMEVFWIGQHTTPVQALGLLAVSFVLQVLLNRTGGFRSSRDRNLVDAALDAVEGVALAIVLVAAVLTVLGEIDLSTPLNVVLGKIANQVLPLSLGIGLANNLLSDDGAPSDGESDDRDGDAATPDEPLDAGIDPTISDLGASLVGAVFVALAIAPTDEVPMLSAARSPVWLVAIAGMSLLATYAIVFAAGLKGQTRRHAQTGLLQHPAIETMASYVVALAACLLLLFLFQRLDPSWRVSIGRVVVLGFPAAVGGAAGRLAI